MPALQALQPLYTIAGKCDELRATFCTGSMDESEERMSAARSDKQCMQYIGNEIDARSPNTLNDLACHKSDRDLIIGIIRLVSSPSSPSSSSQWNMCLYIVSAMVFSSPALTIHSNRIFSIQFLFSVAPVILFIAVIAYMSSCELRVHVVI